MTMAFRYDGLEVAGYFISLPSFDRIRGVSCRNGAAVRGGTIFQTRLLFGKSLFGHNSNLAPIFKSEVSVSNLSEIMGSH